ncbi:ATP-binding protein [bacterium]|nr:ATP-binding protein [bacterium]
MLLIDEVHRHKNWGQEIKNIYDSFPALKLIIAGSSSLELQAKSTDLSRRAIRYPLWGLSFREYLNLTLGLSIEPIELNQIFTNHIELASDLKLPADLLRHFRDYLRFGVYPYFNEGIKEYPLCVQETIEKVIAEDIPMIFGMKADRVQMLRRLLQIVSSAPPFTLEVNNLSQELRVSKEYLMLYLRYLEKSELITILGQRAKGKKVGRKSPKLYLNNPNLFFAINTAQRLEIHLASVRESFFLHQVRVKTGVFIDSEYDFVLEHGCRVEIGGRNKKLKTTQQVTEVYSALDDIQIGFANNIPLYLFGMLY